MNITTNYLNPESFYNKFLFWLIRLQPFIEGKAPISQKQFEVLFRILYGCGLRVSEALNLVKEDIDLERRIITIRKAKTGKNQKTTILPYDIPILYEFLANFFNGQKLFPTDRSTVWRFAKNAGRLAGLEIYESQSNRDIDGVWTHLFRKSCSKRMRELGADREYRMKKLRHVFKDAHDTYDAIDIPALLLWESEHMTEPKQVEGFYTYMIETITISQQISSKVEQN